MSYFIYSDWCHLNGENYTDEYFVFSGMLPSFHNFVSMFYQVISRSPILLSCVWTSRIYAVRLNRCYNNELWGWDKWFKVYFLLCNLSIIHRPISGVRASYNVIPFPKPPLYWRDNKHAPQQSFGLTLSFISARAGFSLWKIQGPFCVEGIVTIEIGETTSRTGLYWWAINFRVTTLQWECQTGEEKIKLN